MPGECNLPIVAVKSMVLDWPTTANSVRLNVPTGNDFLLRSAKDVLASRLPRLPPTLSEGKAGWE
jgi:hypothetical protein